MRSSIWRRAAKKRTADARRLEMEAISLKLTARIEADAMVLYAARRAGNEFPRVTGPPNYVNLVVQRAAQMMEQHGESE